jgi:hypothetical protein
MRPDQTHLRSSTCSRGVEEAVEATRLTRTSGEHRCQTRVMKSQTAQGTCMRAPPRAYGSALGVIYACEHEALYLVGSSHELSHPDQTHQMAFGWDRVGHKQTRRENACTGVRRSRTGECTGGRRILAG